MSTKMSQTDGVEERNEITKTVAYLAMGHNVVVEDLGHGRAKVSGRGAHYIREAVEADSRLAVEFGINQHAFVVGWNA